MSELITAQNIDLVVKKNCEIKDEILTKAIRLQTNMSVMKTTSIPQLALLILQGFGLIQIPIEGNICERWKNHSCAEYFTAKSKPIFYSVA